MTTPAKFILNPKAEFAPDTRQWAGCPTIEVTGKRIWCGFFTGGRFEPSQENYVVYSYSDNGRNWVDPYAVAICDPKTGHRAMDNQLWRAPDGSLWATWLQPRFDMSLPVPTYADQYASWLLGFFQPDDFWSFVSRCENPEAETPVWSAPQAMFVGTLRNKPLVVREDKWLFPVWLDPQGKDEYYVYYETNDQGKTFQRKQGPRKISDCYCEEPMITLCPDNSLLFLTRTSLGYIGKSRSYDDGETWTETVLSDIPNPCTRFHIRTLPSGRILLINTPRPRPGDRTGMVCSLSEDNGETFRYHLQLDTRRSCSYPDCTLDDEGNIWATWDVQRDNRQEPVPGHPEQSSAAKEIVVTRFTEEDIMAGYFCSEKHIMPAFMYKCLWNQRI